MALPQKNYSVNWGLLINARGALAINCANSLAARDKANNPGQLSGHVEIDETYIGGKLRKHVKHGKGEYLKNKATVFGMVERSGVLRSQVVVNEKRETLLPIITMHVALTATVSTDMHGTYKPLAKMGYKHGRINHDLHEWKRDIYCTNTIEGFWAHLKKGLKSTHISVSRHHLQSYVNEFSFRYNNRHEPGLMFATMLVQISQQH